MSAPQTGTQAQPPAGSTPGTPLPGSPTLPATRPPSAPGAPWEEHAQTVDTLLHLTSPRHRGSTGSNPVSNPVTLPIDFPASLPADFTFPGTEGLSAAEIFSGPGYQAPRPRTAPAAVAAFVCSLVSFMPGAGLVAVGLGWWALRRLRATTLTGESLALFAIVLGGVTTAAWLWISLLIGLAVSLG